MKRSYFPMITLILSLGISSLVEAREIFWTGLGSSPYGVQDCLNVAYYDGLQNVRVDCQSHFGYSYQTCVNAQVTKTVQGKISGDYYNTTCELKVYILLP